MSRSYKKNPFMGIAGRSDKQDKRLANRRLRRVIHTKLNSGNTDFDEVALPALREVSDVWDMAKDGKMRLSEGSLPAFKKFLRK